MASDDDFFVVRKFGTVCARVILMLQDRIVILTEELEKEDNECRQLGLDNGTLRHDPRPRRQQILEELAWRLEHYSERHALVVGMVSTLISEKTGSS